MNRFLMVCLGGAVGTGARYTLASWLTERTGPGFPWGTLLVNALGSLILGALAGAIAHGLELPPSVRLAVTTGMMGGFTTYSTFNLETLRLVEERGLGLAVANVAVTVTLCLALGLAGWAAGAFAFDSPA